MEDNTREFIQKMTALDARLRHLYEEHERYEKELMEYGRRAFLTSEEQQREKALKIAKCKGKEKIFRLVDELRSAA